MGNEGVQLRSGTSFTRLRMDLQTKELITNRLQK